MKIQVRDGEFNLEIFENRFHKDVVFLHGNLASNRWWHPTVEHWQAEKIDKGSVNQKTGSQKSKKGRLILLEWRGSGKSSAPTSESQLTIEELAKDVVETLEALSETLTPTLPKTQKISSYHLVGHSTGGIIALCAALQAPTLFEKLVLLDPVSPKGVQLTPEMLGAFELMKNDKAICAQVMASTIKNVDVESSLFKGIVEDTFATAKLNWVGIPKAVAAVNIMDQLSQLQQPVLVLHGDEDVILPIADSQLLAEKLPNGKFVCLEGSGHSLNIENPKEFVSHCLQFLN